jgi:isohexenylglutaconyl-CoA hydratase
MQVISNTSCLEARIEAQVLFLTLNRPAVRNALSAELVSELSETFAKLSAGNEVRAVVIRGSGDNFCAGGDIKDMKALIQRSNNGDLDFIANYNSAAGKLFHLVNEAPLAVIALLEGAVLGGGLGLACAADICIALPGARFGLPETGLGLIPAQVAPFIRRRIGESNARLLAISGGQIDRSEAKRIGLVHYLAEDEEQLAQTLSQLLTNIKDCAPQALATAKHLMFTPDSREAETPQQLARLFAEAMRSQEALEGTAAFAERRKPRWNG